jgi:hypothetical protein
MDLYLWSSTNNTPDKAYYGSYFNNALDGNSSDYSFVNPDGTLKPYVDWNGASGDTGTVPCVYYIDLNGNVVHTAFGGITGSGSPTTGTGGGGGGPSICRCGTFIENGVPVSDCIGPCGD